MEAAEPWAELVALLLLEVIWEEAAVASSFPAGEECIESVIIASVFGVVQSSVRLRLTWPPPVSGGSDSGSPIVLPCEGSLQTIPYWVLMLSEYQ